MTAQSSDVDMAAEFIAATSESHLRHLTSMYGMSAAERRENLLALAQAVDAADAVPSLTKHLELAVGYYALISSPMPAFGRLLRAVRACDAAEADKALDRLVAA